jgi:hypothetical protein
MDRLCTRSRKAVSKNQKNRYQTPVFKELGKIHESLCDFYRYFNVLPINLQKWRPHSN